MYRNPFVASSCVIVEARVESEMMKLPPKLAVVKSEKESGAEKDTVRPEAIHTRPE
jgi:hypothetical protein